MNLNTIVLFPRPAHAATSKRRSLNAYSNIKRSLKAFETGLVAYLYKPQVASQRN